MSNGEKEKSYSGSNYAEFVAFLGPMVQEEGEMHFIGETAGAHVFLKAERFSLT